MRLLFRRVAAVHCQRCARDELRRVRGEENGCLCNVIAVGETFNVRVTNKGFFKRLRLGACQRAIGDTVAAAVMSAQVTGGLPCVIDIAALDKAVIY